MLILSVAISSMNKRVTRCRDMSDSWSHGILPLETDWIRGVRGGFCLGNRRSMFVRRFGFLYNRYLVFPFVTGAEGFSLVTTFAFIRSQLRGCKYSSHSFIIHCLHLLFIHSFSF